MYPTSSQYGNVARYGGVQYAVCDAWRGGVVIKTDLAITAGSVTDDSSGGVRRTLSVELFPELGLWELLAPTGTQLRPRSVTRYPSGQTEVLPFGVFDIDAQSMSYGTGGTIKVTGSDKWRRIQQARFLSPYASTPGLFVREQISQMIRGALGSSEAVTILATSTATVGSLVWERDRDKAIEELAQSIGAYVSFDRTGVATIEDLPTVGPTAVWTVDASETGVLLAADRDRDRKRTYNIVVVASDKTDGEAPFPPQFVWDNDPNSDTYAGPGAGHGPVPPSPSSAGPFGQVPYFYTSPLLWTAAQATTAGVKILAKVTGRAAQLGLSAVPNHALDSLDVIDVQLPAERYRPVLVGTIGGEGFGTGPFGTVPFGSGTGRRIWRTEPVDPPVERHIIGQLTHPLLPTEAQRIDTRSTRTDEFS